MCHALRATGADIGLFYKLRDAPTQPQPAPATASTGALNAEASRDQLGFQKTGEDGYRGGFIFLLFITLIF